MAVVAASVVVLHSVDAVPFRPVMPTLSVPDTPYVEVVSSRFVCNDGGATVNGWGVTPFATVPTQVVATPATTTSPLGFLFLADNALWQAWLPINRSSTSAGMTSSNASLWQYPVEWSRLQGVSVVTATDRAAVLQSGDVVVVHGGSVTAAGVEVVSCSGDECKVTASYPSTALAFGVVYAVAVVSSAGGAGFDVWLGCDAGLVHLSADGVFTLPLDGDSKDVGGAVVAVVASAERTVAVGNQYHLW